MLDEEFIKAIDGFAEHFEEGQIEKVEAIEKGGMDLRDKDS